MDLPWDPSIANGKMTLHARLCAEDVDTKGGSCRLCMALGRNGVYGMDGLHELLRLKTRRIEFYRLRGLNQARKLATAASTLDKHKRFLTAVASKKIERVDRLIRIGLRQGQGIKSLLRQTLRAAGGLYKPKSYEEEDERWGSHPSPPFATNPAFHLS